MRFYLATSLVVVGCGSDAPSTTDARVAPPDVAVHPDAGPDAGPSGAHVVYLAFDGVDVTKGAVDDATTSTSRLVPANGTMPAFLASDSDRSNKITAITNEVRRIVAPFDIAVVTMRPSNGPYDLIAFGGRPQDVGFDQNVSLFDLGVTDCANSDASNVGFLWNWEDNLPTAALARVYGQQAVSLLAMAHGVTTTKLGGDCLCADVPNVDYCDNQMPCMFHMNTTGYVCGATGSTTGINTSDGMVAAFGTHP